ncbi:hypothetical protein [Novosphingobium sp.]|uniref:hypothetical protein n=1 Tax=Novosphingobium sp. TaxID=1874826 RepID=UPI0038BA0547
MGKRGRPTKEPSQEDRAKVKELLGENAPISDLARMFGVSEPTFRKYFRAEILSVKKSVEISAPARRVTDEMREKVKRYIGCKMPVEKVALAIGYDGEDDLDAFKVDFRKEIAVGAAVYRAKVLDRLDAQMVGGLIGATNRLEALTQITDAGDEAQDPEERNATYHHALLARMPDTIGHGCTRQLQQLGDPGPGDEHHAGHERDGDFLAGNRPPRATHDNFGRSPCAQTSLAKRFGKAERLCRLNAALAEHGETRRRIERTFAQAVADAIGPCGLADVRAFVFEGASDRPPAIAIVCDSIGQIDLGWIEKTNTLSHTLRGSVAPVAWRARAYSALASTLNAVLPVFGYDDMIEELSAYYWDGETDDEAARHTMVTYFGADPDDLTLPSDVAANLYPWCSANPADVYSRVDGIDGGDWAARDDLHFVNLPAVVAEAKKADQVFVCWGAIARDCLWLDHVVEEIQTGEGPWPDLWCWGKTKAGAPKHPMARGAHRIPADQKPILWRAK